MKLYSYRSSCNPWCGSHRITLWITCLDSISLLICCIYLPVPMTTSPERASKVHLSIYSLGIKTNFVKPMETHIVLFPPSPPFTWLHGFSISPFRCCLSSLQCSVLQFLQGFYNPLWDRWIVLVVPWMRHFIIISPLRKLPGCTSGWITKPLGTKFLAIWSTLRLGGWGWGSIVGEDMLAWKRGDNILIIPKNANMPVVSI